MSFLKPISISLSPNTEKDDIWLAFKLLFQPWQWKKGKAINKLEEEFKKYLGVKYATSFNSGRSAFLAILNSPELDKGDEVLLQAFTCNAAVNPIIWSGLKPVYVDCDEKNFNIDIENLKRKITSKSRAVMVQHTFGLSADMDEILEICQENNLILIEDCAHSLGAGYGGKKIGTFGKAAFFSFGRDKVISSVYGGMAVTNDGAMAQKLGEFQKEIGYPSCCWISQQLWHPVLMNWLILPTYRIFGKYLLILFQWLHILSKAVHWKEKRGKKPGYFPKRLPNALAVLALNQFKKLDRFNQHRKEIAKFYFENFKNTSFELPEVPGNQDHIFLRFTVKYPKAHQIIKKAWQKNILIGDWYTTPIAPHDTKLEKVQYVLGSCPKAEKLAKTTLNLPTHINISQKEAPKIVDFLKKYGSRRRESSSPLLLSLRESSVIKEINEKSIWENFLLEGGEEKTFLSSWNWGEFQKMMGNKIWRLGVFENNNLLSVALMLKVAARRGIFLFLPHGPVSAKATAGKPNIRYKILKTLLEELKKIAKEEKASFIRIAPIWERNKENIKIFKDLGFKPAPIHIHPEVTWELDITPSEEDLLMNMRKTTRYLIRQAEKNKDIEILQSKNLGDIEIFNKLYQEVVDRHHFVPFSLNYLKNEFLTFNPDNQPIRRAQGCPECTEGQISLFFGKYKGEIIASAFIIFWSKKAFYHQAALSLKYPKIPVSYLLQWRAIQEAKKRDCKVYNFWGITPNEDPKHPWAGLTLFKMGFGGNKKEYVKTQDLPFSCKYWLTFLFEKLRRTKRGL